MKNPIGLGLAVAATASLAFAHGEGVGKKDGKDSPSSTENLFQEDGLKISYKPGSGVTFDGGDDYSLNFSGRIQAKWFFSNFEEGEDLNSFAARRARTRFRGHVFNRDVTYYLQMEHTGGTSIKDAAVGWQFWTDEQVFANLALGLRKFRSGLQADQSSSRLEFPERSLATRTFADSRATGAMVEGGLGEAEDGTNTFFWHVGAVNNDTARGSVAVGEERLNRTNKINWILGLHWDPQGEIGDQTHWEGDLDHSGEFKSTWGAFFTLGQDSPGGTDYTTFTINAHGSTKLGNGLAFQGEFWYRSDDPDVSGATDTSSMGWYLQGSWTSAPGEGTQWGIPIRVSMVDIGDDGTTLLNPIGSINGGSFGTFAGANTPWSGSGTVLEAQIGLGAYYYGHKLKSQLAYTYQDVDTDVGTDTTNHGVDLMFTLLF